MPVLNGTAITALAAAAGLVAPFAVAAAIRDERPAPPPVADPFPLWHSARPAPAGARTVTFRALRPATPVPTMGRAERGRSASRRAPASRPESVSASTGPASARAADASPPAGRRAPVVAVSAPSPVRAAPVAPAPARRVATPVRPAQRPAAPQAPRESAGPRFDSGESFDSTG